MRIAHLILFIPLLTIGLQACAPIAGGIVAGAAALHDRRSTGTLVEDQNIELKAINRLASNEALENGTNISVTSYNRIVLMTGQATTPELRAQAAGIIANINNVRLVHNEVQVRDISDLKQRTSDAYITTTVKGSMFGIEGMEGFDPLHVKVVTDDGVVYLLGLVTNTEAEAVTETTRRTNGVKRVVRMFEYIDGKDIK